MKDEVRYAESPGIAKKMGRSLQIRPDWEDVKLNIMEDLVRLKFTTHSGLRKKLLRTGDAELIEGNWWGDQFWGVSKGYGENHLGKILMKVRDDFKNESGYK